MASKLSTGQKRRARARAMAKEFRAPGNVIALGLVCLASLYCTGRAFSLKILADMRGEVADTTAILMLAVVSGCMAEIVGAVYLYRHRKHRTKSKAGALLTLTVMVLMLLPIQFSVLSIWVSRTQL